MYKGDCSGWYITTEYKDNGARGHRGGVRLPRRGGGSSLEVLRAYLWEEQTLGERRARTSRSLERMLVEGGDLDWAGRRSYLRCFSGEQIQEHTKTKLLSWDSNLGQRADSEAESECDRVL